MCPTTQMICFIGQYSANVKYIRFFLQVLDAILFLYLNLFFLKFVGYTKCHYLNHSIQWVTEIISTNIIYF